MQPDTIIVRLDQNIAIVTGLVEGLILERARWKPSADKWSILEIINHLADEEVEDFRTRLNLTLHHPTQEWPAIVPENWVIERAYNTQEFTTSLQRFVVARQASVAWLQNLPTPEWRTATDMPGRPSMQAGTLLACWLAHDWLHIRQMTNLHYAYLEHHMHPFSLSYAG